MSVWLPGDDVGERGEGYDVAQRRHVSRETSGPIPSGTSTGGSAPPAGTNAGPPNAGHTKPGAGRTSAGRMNTGRTTTNANAGRAGSGRTSAGPPPPSADPSEDWMWTPIAEEAERAARVLHPDGREMPRPAERRILTVANQKGGVGKTTSTVNLAAALVTYGMRVLVIDLDPQGNASTALGVEHTSGTPSVYEALLGEINLADAAQPSTQSPELLCVPATIDLAGAEIELVSMVAREARLKQALDSRTLDELDVDYVLIDCPPSLGLLTVNALVAAAEVLIPIQCEYYALEGLGQLINNIELVRAHLNRQLHVSTILLTMYDGRTKLADQVTAEVRQHFGERVLRTVIPRSVKVSEAPGFGQTVLAYDPGSRGAMSYLDAAREMVTAQYAEYEAESGR
jgi:chromosome partitioning protein